MLVIPGILVAAVVVGFVMGGRLQRFEGLDLHWWPLVFVAVFLQWAPVPAVDAIAPRLLGTAMLMLSYVLLLVFIGVNRWIPGARLMAVGLLLNLLVVGLNAGMPVSDDAVASAGGSTTLFVGDQSAKHHLMSDQDLLPFLGDVIPIPPPVSIVISVGDVLLYSGMAFFVIQIMRGRSRGNPRPLAPWFLSYRGKHAPAHWRMAARYRTTDRAGAGRPGSAP
jgi:hypothetical protein